MKGYEKLEWVFAQAADQAANGKGRERHVHHDQEPFHEQTICRGGRRFGPGCLLYQAWKKTDEVPALLAMENGQERALREIYGAMNYLAAAAIVIAEGMENVEKKEARPDIRKPVVGYFASTLGANIVSWLESERAVNLDYGFPDNGEGCNVDIIVVPADANFEKNSFVSMLLLSAKEEGVTLLYVTENVTLDELRAGTSHATSSPRNKNIAKPGTRKPVVAYFESMFNERIARMLTAAGSCNLDIMGCERVDILLLPDNSQYLKLEMMKCGREDLAGAAMYRISIDITQDELEDNLALAIDAYYKQQEQLATEQRR